MLKVTERDGKQIASADDLQNWDKNPRIAKKQDIDRLTAQIKKLGAYKPLIVNEDGVVLGGNMRFRVLKDILKQKDIWVSVVKAEDEATMLEYALSDNDAVGSYRELDLGELLSTNEIDLGMYKAQMGAGVDLQGILDKLNRGPEDEPEVEFTTELMESQNYVVLVWDNEMDFLQAQSVLGLKPVKALDSKEGYKKVGIGRVLDGKTAIKRLLGDES